MTTTRATGEAGTEYPAKATAIHLAQRPVGLPGDDTWEVREHDLPAPGEPLAEGQVLVQVQYISLDPAMRGWLNAARSYIPPVEVGAIMRAGGVGVVLASQAEGFAPGDEVFGYFGVIDYALVDVREAGVAQIDTSIAPQPTWLGALGMTGHTAYFGLTEVGKLQKGDTVLVSGAAGAVGSVVGQLAKAAGAGKVIGIAGGEEKCAWLKEIGFDEAIDYKNDNPLKKLREIAPEGVNVFFDNIGGDILDAGLANLARGARVVICGAISTYNDEKPQPGPSRYMALLVFRASMQGFVVFDYQDRYHEATEAIADHIQAGRLVARETVWDAQGEGVKAFPDALLGLFSGANTGKLVLRIGD